MGEALQRTAGDKCLAEVRLCHETVDRDDGKVIDRGMIPCGEAWAIFPFAVIPRRITQHDPGHAELLCLMDDSHQIKADARVRAVVTMLLVHSMLQLVSTRRMLVEQMQVRSDDDADDVAVLNLLMHDDLLL